MKLEILGDRPRVAGRCFKQKTLSSEIVWDGMGETRPTDFVVFRMSFRTAIYRGPNGEQWNYDQLLENHRERGVRFPGTGHFKNAVDIEYWEDEGMDGHVEWHFQTVYRMFLNPEEGEDDSEWHWLHTTSGDVIMRCLGDHVYEMNRDRRRAEYDATHKGSSDG